MRGTRELAHVDADFGQHHFGGAPLKAWDRDQTFNRLCDRGQQLLNAPAEFRASFLDVVDVGQQAAYHEAMVRPEATGQRLAQFRELLAQLAASQVGQHRRIGGAGYLPVP